MPPLCILPQAVNSLNVIAVETESRSHLLRCRRVRVAGSSLVVTSGSDRSSSLLPGLQAKIRSLQERYGSDPDTWPLAKGMPSGTEDSAPAPTPPPGDPRTQLQLSWQVGAQM